MWPITSWTGMPKRQRSCRVSRSDARSCALAAEYLGVAEADVLDPDGDVVEADDVPTANRGRHELVDRPRGGDGEVSADTGQLVELHVGPVGGEGVVDGAHAAGDGVVLDDQLRVAKPPAKAPVVTLRVARHVPLALAPVRDQPLRGSAGAPPAWRAAPCHRPGCPPRAGRPPARARSPGWRSSPDRPSRRPSSPRPGRRSPSPKPPPSGTGVARSSAPRHDRRGARVAGGGPRRDPAAGKLDHEGVRARVAVRLPGDRRPGQPLALAARAHAGELGVAARDPGPAMAGEHGAPRLVVPDGDVRPDLRDQPLRRARFGLRERARARVVAARSRHAAAPAVGEVPVQVHPPGVAASPGRGARRG